MGMHWRYGATTHVLKLHLSPWIPMATISHRVLTGAGRLVACGLQPSGMHQGGLGIHGGGQGGTLPNSQQAHRDSNRRAGRQGLHADLYLRLELFHAAPIGSMCSLQKTFEAVEQLA